jgi:hypothetical protein
LTELMMVLLAAFFAASLAGVVGISVGKKAALTSPSMAALPPARAARRGPSEAINLVNRYVTMARGRAVRVENESITIVYSRENKTKGRVKFKMDTAFDDVHEGDVGVLVIIEQDEIGQHPFYKFIRDADIPNIDDVLEVGTGDDLTDDIYRALRESKE